MGNRGNEGDVRPRARTWRYSTLSTCSDRLLGVVLAHPSSQHTTRWRSDAGAPVGWMHGCRRALGMRSFPFVSLAARGAASPTSSSRRPTNRCVLSAGFAGANRRRPRQTFFEATVPSGRLAQLFLLHAVSTRLPVVREADVHRTNRGARPQADRGRGPSRQCRHTLGAAAVRTASPTRSRQMFAR